jgi:hypothetical protein
MDKKNPMTEEQQERAKILLQATIDILKKCDEGMYVKNVLEVTAEWDGVECDGYCLFEEVKGLMADVQDNAP